MKFETATRTIEFEFEKKETYTIRRTRTIVAQWCGDCGGEVKMSSPEDAATIVGLSTRSIYSGVEAGLTHFTESPDGSLMVCLHSLAENGASPQLKEGELDRS